MIAITGATGNTGKPAAEALLAKGEKVRAIGRDAKKLESLVQKGAEAFVGDAQDASFLTKAFEGAKGVFLLLPADVGQQDMRAFQEGLSDVYATAVVKSRVPYAVTLSSIGAQHSEKTGPIVGLHNMEKKLNRIAGLNVLNLRPGFFMENFSMSIQPLRTMGILPGGLPGDVPMPMIAAKDIGTYAAGRLAALDFIGSSAQELHGQRDITLNEAAKIIGKAIGKPDLKYMQVPFMMLEPALVQMGMPKSTAALMVEMWKGGIAGLVAPQEPRTPKNTTPTTLESFVAEVFAPVYLGKTVSA
jgi:uncharacterized protein YbjT (DUF2867 family)